MPNVLLAEDEFLIRAVMVDALDAIGLKCIEAATGQAAIDVIAGKMGLAAIIVDIGLPDMSMIEPPVTAMTGLERGLSEAAASESAAIPSAAARATSRGRAGASSGRVASK